MLKISPIHFTSCTEETDEPQNTTKAVFQVIIAYRDL